MYKCFPIEQELVNVSGLKWLIYFLKYFLPVFAMLGMLSPASRGSLVTAIIFLYVFMG